MNTATNAATAVRDAMARHTRRYALFTVINVVFFGIFTLVNVLTLILKFSS